MWDEHVTDLYVCQIVFRPFWGEFYNNNTEIIARQVDSNLFERER